MLSFLETLNHFVWGIPALVLILGVGIYLTIRTGFSQINLFPKALHNFIKNFKVKADGKDGVSAYRALCTALAATVGTGNLAGVAGAIAIGGPGAIFWMWVCAVLGMITKYTEATLAIRYRKKNNNSEIIGGPMYYIENGIGKKWRWMGVLYCVFGVIACFGVGNATQINAVVGGINNVIVSYGGRRTIFIDLTLGIILAILIAVMLSGGAKRIGAIAEGLVPFASVAYILLGMVVLACRAKEIPVALWSIIEGAISPRAVTGGVIGSAFTSLRVGASRGVFTNEAGMGTAAIAHASARVDHPVEQGLMGIMEVFLDTIVICTMTALVILCSGVRIPYGMDVGVALTAQAFGAVLGDWVGVPIAFFLCCFSIATILGWGLYGTRCAQYIFGEGAWKPFVYLQCVTVIFGAVAGTGTIWLLSETVNGLMAIPNLIALAYLGSEVGRLTVEYKKCARQCRAQGRLR